ncbi:MAG: SH3 domain-containing protein [Lactobacillales bacterium]|nr:SH3 domain-containing protein [Lactobacillales bacterium]
MQTHAQDVTQPYFSSLRYDVVNLRTGPGNRFPIAWAYLQKNYPVKVIDKHDLWYQIQEIDGTTGWVHQTMVRARRYALVTEEETLRRKPDDNARRAAIVQKGTIGRILKCPENSEWCQLEFQKEDKTIKGWLKKKFFYGVYDYEVID